VLFPEHIRTAASERALGSDAELRILAIMNELPGSRRIEPSTLRAQRLIALALPFVAAVALAPRGYSQAPPNIVLILADDLGYGDVGPYDHDLDPDTPLVSNTPRLDQLTQEGVKLTDFYACSSVCTPTRAGIITGRHHARVGIMGVLGSDAVCGLPGWEITLAELLRARGYATELVGKWHLGTEAEFNPTVQGFDDFYGIPYSNDMSPYVILHGTTPVEPCPDQASLMQCFRAEAETFISNSVAQAKPFFLYMPSVAVHVPVYVGSEFDGITGRGLYADCVYEMDWSVGKILDRLTELGVADNTIVIFTSDNGPWHNTHFPPPGTPDPWRWVGGSAGPLRGSKAMVYEGGIREPFVARWPGHFPAGVSISQPAVIMDLFTTLALAGGAQLPTDRVLDGMDIGPLLSGTGTRDGQDFYFYQLANRCDGSPSNKKLWAIRSGKWKQILDYWENPKELYDLSTDLGETTPLNLPDITAMLMDKAHNFDCGLESPPLPSEPTSNVARGHATSASSSVDCSTSGQAVDGSTGTYWRSAGCGDQWLSVDLGQTCEVHEVILKWGSNFGQTYDIDVSSDSLSWTKVQGNQNGPGGQETLVLPSTLTRFVRLRMYGGHWSSGYTLKELEVQGTTQIPTRLHNQGHAH
jgi:arylsulfatase A-like enzyme